MNKNQAFAIYSEDDHSLTFYAGRFVPDDQECYNNKPVTGIWVARDAAFDVERFNSLYGWGRFDNDIKMVITDSSFATIKPFSTSKWFYKLKKCETIDLTYLNTSNVKNTSCMFAECRKLKDIKMQNFNVDHVKNMSQMFTNCSSLTSLDDLLSWQTERCTNMFLMFCNCSSLEKLDLSGWDTHNVKTMTSMFNGCSSLKSVGDIKSWDTGAVKRMDHMFEGTDQLELDDEFFK